jgi:predicted secreted protein
MAVTTALAIYFVLWWVVLFAVLPFGVRSQHEDGNFEAGTDPGAPVFARIWIKLLWTTIVSAAIFALCSWLYLTKRVTLDDLATLWGLLK